MSLTSEHFSILRLIRTPHLGPQTFWKLMDWFQSAVRVIENWQEAQSVIKRKIELVPEESILLEIERTSKAGVQFLFFTDSFYPSFFHVLNDRPPVLTFKGDISFLSQRKIAIVGARNASAHGRKLAYLMAKDLGDHQWKTISGLARGIDTSAHQGSLASGTVAVLGNGIQTIYPEENKGLYHEISEKGLLLSEFSLEAEPHVGHFPKRNRLIAALAEGVVVVEAAYQSGSLLTATYGLDMGKDIFAVPGSPLDPRCRGSNRLIKQGAVLVESGQDILEVLDKTQWVLDLKRKEEKKKKPSVSREPNELCLLTYLSTIPMPLDELVELSHMQMNDLSSLLTDLELRGKVMRHPGNKISLALQG